MGGTQAGDNTETGIELQQDATFKYHLECRYNKETSVGRMNQVNWYHENQLHKQLTSSITLKLKSIFDPQIFFQFPPGDQ